jgi:hypothetical protein
VVVEDADLEAIERSSDSRSIEISRFVELGEVDPIYFDRTYFLVPAAQPAARRYGPTRTRPSGRARTRAQLGRFRAPANRSESAG